MKTIILILITVYSFSLSAQKKSSDSKAPENWFNLSYEKNKIYGVGTERTYTEIKKGRRADTIIVCVLDGGVDQNHEDLKSIMWQNPGEIAGNGIDDDKNGYVDDIFGWNFIGGKNGESVQYDNLEFVRLLRPLAKKYADLNENTIPLTEAEDYAKYKKLDAELQMQLTNNQKTFDQIVNVKKIIDGMKEEIKVQFAIDSVRYSDFKKYKPSENYKKIYLVLSLGIRNETSWNELSTEINKGYEQKSAIIKYNLNLEYDSRSIVGDNYEDGTERFYGNADVKGPDASHGTHVAGIIAANRLNSIGILGVAAPVKIMAVRCVPAGDERDKDVANGIRYAVDNGAKIINMSFGKSYSYNKDLVDDAVRYAESKGVLLIHAAGNSHQNNDVKDNFPNDNLGKELDASNWIEVGAISWKRGKEMIAKFSNYGKNEVDVFAPGVDINSCKVDGGYIELSGTSMAAPVCAGVAALIWIYHPEFTPDQVKSIIETASDKSMIKKKVILPGEKKKKVKFGSLCKSGGVVDLYAAFQFADKKK